MAIVVLSRCFVFIDDVEVHLKSCFEQSTRYKIVCGRTRMLDRKYLCMYVSMYVLLSFCYNFQVYDRGVNG